MARARDVDLSNLTEVLTRLDELERARLLLRVTQGFYDYAKFNAVPGGAGMDGRDGPSERQSLAPLVDEAERHVNRVLADYR